MPPMRDPKPDSLALGPGLEPGFANVLRHQFCAPLAVIRGQAQLLRRRARQSDDLAAADRLRLERGLAAIDAASLELEALVDYLTRRGVK